jgi:hypothetical protein
VWLSFFLSALVVGTAALAPEPGKASGTLTVDGSTTPLSHAVRTTKPNVFDESALDTVIVLSDRPLSVQEASNDGELLARAQQGELVAVAIRFDERRGRTRLFNVAINHKGLAGTALFPDVWVEHTYKAGVGTLKIPTRELNGHTYSGSVDFAVAVPTETAVVNAPAAAGLPAPSKTPADRKATTALLIQALQEGDERRALDIVALGVDPNGRDEKMNIPVINWAVMMCQPPVVKALVELKADLSHERLPGMTLLSEATAACPEAAPFLRAAGAK